MLLEETKLNTINETVPKKAPPAFNCGDYSSIGLQYLDLANQIANISLMDIDVSKLSKIEAKAKGLEISTSEATETPEVELSFPMMTLDTNAMVQDQNKEPVETLEEKINRLVSQIVTTEIPKPPAKDVPSKAVNQPRKRERGKDDEEASKKNHKKKRKVSPTKKEQDSHDDKPKQPSRKRVREEPEQLEPRSQPKRRTKSLASNKWKETSD